MTEAEPALRCLLPPFGPCMRALNSKGPRGLSPFCFQRLGRRPALDDTVGVRPGHGVENQDPRVGGRATLRSPCVSGEVLCRMSRVRE